MVVATSRLPASSIRRSRRERQAHRSRDERTRLIEIIMIFGSTEFTIRPLREDHRLSPPVPHGREPAANPLHHRHFVLAPELVLETVTARRDLSAPRARTRMAPAPGQEVDQDLDPLARPFDAVRAQAA